MSDIGMLRYVKSEWAGVPELWDEMLLQLYIARASKESINYFFICSKVFVFSKRKKRCKTYVKLEEGHGVRYVDPIEELAFKEKIRGLNLQEMIVISLLLRGKSIKEARLSIGMNWIQWGKFKKNLIDGVQGRKNDNIRINRQ